jgi:hypothetical protein
MIAKDGSSSESGEGLSSVGALDAEKPTQIETGNSKSGCDDADDGGNNPYIRGVTKVTYNKKVTAFTDTCSTADHLTEYYCDGTEYKFYSKLCAYGCLEGACRQGDAGEADEGVSPPAPEPAEEPEDAAPRTIPECFDGFRDLEETDTDCGGPNCKPCAYGKHCLVKRDCASPLTCNQRNFLCMEVVH